MRKDRRLLIFSIAAVFGALSMACKLRLLTPNPLPRERYVHDAYEGDAR
jgi:hypothetical protein